MLLMVFQFKRMVASTQQQYCRTCQNTACSCGLCCGAYSWSLPPISIRKRQQMTCDSLLSAFRHWSKSTLTMSRTPLSWCWLVQKCTQKWSSKEILKRSYPFCFSFEFPPCSSQQAFTIDLGPWPHLLVCHCFQNAVTRQSGRSDAFFMLF